MYLPLFKISDRVDQALYTTALDGWILVLEIAANILFVGPLHPSPRVYFSLFAILSLIETVLVSTTGGSIGHHIFGIRLIDQSSGIHIGIFRVLVAANSSLTPAFAPY